MTATGSLKEIQDKALEIARAFAWPEDNCAREGLNAVVNSIDRASITPNGDIARLVSREA